MPKVEKSLMYLQVEEKLEEYAITDLYYVCIAKMDPSKMNLHMWLVLSMLHGGELMSNCQNCQWPHMLKKCKRQIGSSPQPSGWKCKNIWVATTELGFLKNTLGFEVWRGDPKKHTIQTIKPQEGFAWNMRGWIPRTEHFFSQDPWVPTWIYQKHQVHLGTVYHSLIPYVFSDILLGKWYSLRWIRQVPKTTRMYCFFQFGALGFAGLALGKCPKHTLPNGGAYLVGAFNPPEKY